MTYTEILAIGFSKLTAKEMQSTEEAPPATLQERKWREGFQFVRARRHKAAGNATVPDLKVLKKDPRIVITNRDFKRAMAREY